MTLNCQVQKRLFFPIYAQNMTQLGCKCVFIWQRTKKLQRLLQTEENSFSKFSYWRNFKANICR